MFHTPAIYECGDDEDLLLADIIELAQYGY
jgi:hypothetical protein